MRLLDLVEQKRPDILRLAKRYGATNVRLVGSVPRGQEHDGADVDLLAELPGWHAQLDLQKDLQGLLGVEVDVVAQPHPYMRDHMLAEAVPLEAAGFRQRVLAQSHNPPVIDRDEVHLRLMLDYA
ncbi:MAG: nucleotidyltransferase domain-containing protein [Chloroflexi bacterium]|nr:nucleotidyltransferase domain-containing protein [Chloroflexota bacterium]